MSPSDAERARRAGTLQGILRGLEPAVLQPAGVIEEARLGLELEVVPGRDAVSTPVLEDGMLRSRHPGVVELEGRATGRTADSSCVRPCGGEPRPGRPPGRHRVG